MAEVRKVAGRPMMQDYADNWNSLLELFVSVSGLKLRLNIPDTIIVKEGRMIGWFYTNKDGVVCRCSLHEISPSGVLQKLVGSATVDARANPYQYVALCHFSSGVSRPLRQQELSSLLADLSSPYESPRPKLDPDADEPFCIQAYIIPTEDLRYLFAYGGYEQASSTAFARRFSARYTHISDPPVVLPEDTKAVQEAQRSAAATLTAEELVVESQLIAMGLLEPRRPQFPGEESADGQILEPEESEDGVPDTVIPASKRAKDEMSRMIQGLISYVERAHGLRIQALVAEFVQAHSQVMVLVAVHAVQWDGRASRGRLGTFTERWQDYTNGLAPPPAVQPPSRRSQAPGLFMSNDNNALIMTERTGAGVASGATLMGSATDLSSPKMNLGRAPILHQSLTDASGTAHIAAARPGSAPATLLKRLRVGFPGPRNGQSSLRNSMASARRGAGGNPISMPPSIDSYALYTQREHLTTDTVAGSLMLEVEILKERLQRQTDIAVRAEAALTTLAMSSQHTQVGLTRQLDDVKSIVEQATQGRSMLESEYDRLLIERQKMNSRITELETELSQTKAMLDQDRGTLAETVRTASQKEDNYGDLVARLRQDNEQLNNQAGGLQRRLEEEQELMEAARNQLYDYKQLVTTLQSQLRRGKNKPAGATGISNAPVNASIQSLHTASQAGALLGNHRTSGFNQDLLNPDGIRNMYDNQEPGFEDGGGGGDGGYGSAGKTGSGGLPDDMKSLKTSAGAARRPGAGGPLKGPSQHSRPASRNAVGRSNARPDELNSNGDQQQASDGDAGVQPTSAPRALLEVQIPAGRTDVQPASGSTSPTIGSPGRTDRRVDDMTQASSQPYTSGVIQTFRPALSNSFDYQSPVVQRPQQVQNISNNARPASADVYGYGNAYMPMKRVASFGLPGAAAGGNIMLNPLVEALMSRPPQDSVTAAITEMRRVRKGQASAQILMRDGGAGALSALLSQGSFIQDSNTPSDRVAATVAKLAQQKKNEVVTMEDKKKKVTNPWVPQYDMLHLQDLFIAHSDLTDRMMVTMDFALKLLQRFEKEFLEIYNYYASLGQVVIVDQKMTMIESQFSKMAKSCNPPAQIAGQLDYLAGDAFAVVADRTASYYSEFGTSGTFITFPEFPEAVCRLAAAWFDWRPPENPEEIDEDIVQPESLRTTPLANISELPHCNCYGVGPTAKLSPAAREAEVAKAAAEAAKMREGALTCDESGQPQQAPESGGINCDDDCAITAMCELGPQPADVVLYTMIKTFILYYLLPSARRNGTAGTRISKGKAQKRTAPASVWAV